MPVERDALEGGPDAIYTLAEIYAVVGESDAAMDRLEQVLSIPSTYTSYFIQADPELASLRTLPRF